MNTKMIWSDAWILLATIYVSKEGPAELSEVIGAADYMQHAIVTFEEMEGALGRLVSSGYLNFEEGKLCPSQKTMDYYLSIAKPRRSIRTVESDMEEFIGASGWDGTQTPQMANRDVSFPDLTRKRFDEAVEEYLHRMSPRKKR